MKIILKEIFYVLTGALAVFAAMEIIHPYIVLAYFNINYALIFWLATAILLLVIKEKNYD